jgi:hypothetical protein
VAEETKAAKRPLALKLGGPESAFPSAPERETLTRWAFWPKTVVNAAKRIRRKTAAALQGR